MPAARAQNLRVLEGRFVLARVTDVRSVAVDADLLAFVVGPDGGDDPGTRQREIAADPRAGEEDAAGGGESPSRACG